MQKFKPRLIAGAAWFFTIFVMAIPIARNGAKASAAECGDQTIVDLVSLSDAQLTDSDQDLIPDAYDNCLIVPNPLQGDSDRDGYGNQCDADWNNDGNVGGADFLIFSQFFGSASAEYDIDFDGLVGGTEFLLFSSMLGKAPGPSGLSCAGNIPCPGGE